MSDSPVFHGFSNFTSDFFNGLEETLAGNSIDMSRDGLKSQMSGKSEIFRQIKEQTVYKLEQRLTKVVLRYALDQIYIEGEKRVRRAAKTEVNIAKVLYRLNLTLGMKFEKMQNQAFRKMAKYSQKYALVGVKDPVEKRNIKVDAIFRRLLSILQTRQAFQCLKTRSESVDRVYVFQQILGDVIKAKTKIGFTEIKCLADRVNKKSFFIEAIIVWANSRLRDCFAQIKTGSNKPATLTEYSGPNANQMLPNQSKLSPDVSQTASVNVAPQSSKRLDSKLKTKPKIERSNKLSCEGLGRPSPLKFNKGLKRQSDTNTQFLKTKTQSIDPPPSQLIKQLAIAPVNLLKQPKFPLAVSMSLNSLQEFPIRKVGALWGDNNMKNLYHINSSELKQELPDFPDTLQRQQQNAEPKGESYGIQFRKTPKITHLEGGKQEKFRRSVVKSQISNESSLSRRLHKLEQKQPLDFGSKKELKFSRAKKSSSASKKEPLSAKLIQRQERHLQTEPNELNFHSMKQYYFPEQDSHEQFRNANRKLIQRGSNSDLSEEKMRAKWLSSDAKNRLSEAYKVRDVVKDQKYFEELRERYGKKSMKPSISLKNFVDRSFSSRSSSKLSRDSKPKLQSEPLLTQRIIQSPYTTRVQRGRTGIGAPQLQSFVPRQWVLSPEGKNSRLYQSPIEREIRFRFQNTKQKKKTNA